MSVAARLLAAPADQQLERLQLDRLVPVAQGAEQRDLGAGSRQRARPRGAPPAGRGMLRLAAELEDPLASSRGLGAAPRTRQRRDHRRPRPCRARGRRPARTASASAACGQSRRPPRRAPLGSPVRSSGRSVERTACGLPDSAERAARRGPHLAAGSVEQPAMRPGTSSGSGSNADQAPRRTRGVGVGEVAGPAARPERLGPRPEDRFGPIAASGPLTSGRAEPARSGATTTAAAAGAAAAARNRSPALEVAPDAGRVVEAPSRR